MIDLVRITLAAALIAASLSVTGCASNDKDDYSVTIVSPVLANYAANDDSSVLIAFKQENGKVVSRTVEAEGSYIGSEDSSISEIRAKAIEAMIKSAVDQVNGQLISDTINIRQTQVGSGELEETKRDVVSQTVGLGKLLSQPECKRRDGQGLETTMVCAGKVAVPLIENVTVKR